MRDHAAHLGVVAAGAPEPEPGQAPTAAAAGLQAPWREDASYISLI